MDSLRTAPGAFHYGGTLKTLHRIQVVEVSLGIILDPHYTCHGQLHIT